MNIHGRLVPANSPAIVFGDIESRLPQFRERCKLRHARHPLHVLVVEDDPLCQRMLNNLLSDQHAIANASDGTGAVDRYLAVAPDIMFLDLGLPYADGFDVLKQIMAIDPEAYVVIISGSSDSDSVALAAALGARGFIPKPFPLDKLDHYLSDCSSHFRKQAG